MELIGPKFARPKTYLATIFGLPQAWSQFIVLWWHFREPVEHNPILACLTINCVNMKFGHTDWNWIEWMIQGSVEHSCYVQTATVQNRTWFSLAKKVLNSKFEFWEYLPLSGLIEPGSVFKIEGQKANSSDN